MRLVGSEGDLVPVCGCGRGCVEREQGFRQMLISSLQMLRPVRAHTYAHRHARAGLRRVP